MEPTPNYVPENSPDAMNPGTEHLPHLHPDHLDSHYERIKQELQDAGVSWHGMLMSESKYLPRIIHPDENISGVAYGWQPGGMVMLIATNHRIIFLDKKPFYLRDDEVSYDNVRGISYYHTGLTSTIVLHTQVQDYTVRTFNKDCVQKFIDYVELRSFEHKVEEGPKDDSTERERAIQTDRDEAPH